MYVHHTYIHTTMHTNIPLHIHEKSENYIHAWMHAKSMHVYTHIDETQTYRVHIYVPTYIPVGKTNIL